MSDDVAAAVSGKLDELHNSNESAARRYFREASLEEKLTILRRKVDLCAVSLVTAGRAYSQTAEILADLQQMISVLTEENGETEETSS
jgi:hypothetical protein